MGTGKTVLIGAIIATEFAMATDLVFAYQRDGRTHSHTPDFVVHATDDRWMLVEIKMTAGLKAAALRDLEARNPGRVFFRILFAYAVIAAPDMAAVAKFLEAEPRVGSA